MIPTFYIICGFLGAGKTTYSQKLALNEKAIHLNPDESCMKLFSKDEYEKDWDTCFSKTIEKMWEKAKELATKNQSVIFDMGFWTKESRKEAIQRAKELGFNPVIHYIYAPDNILKERISKRNGKIAHKNLKEFDKLKQQFEEPKSPEEFVKIKNY